MQQRIQIVLDSESKMVKENAMLAVSNVLKKVHERENDPLSGRGVLAPELTCSCPIKNKNKG